MHTTLWNLVALLFLLTLCSSQAPASEADELRARALAIKKEAVALAKSGRRDQAEQLERQAQELLNAAEQKASAAKVPGEQSADQKSEPAVRELGELLGSLLAKERELRASGAPEPQLKEIRGQIAQVEHKLQELRVQTLPGQSLPPEIQAQAEKLQEATRRIHHIRVAADNLKAAGIDDLAAELTKRAEAMEREVQQAKEQLAIEMKRRAELVAAEHEPKASVETKLQEEIERLRAEVRELRQKIEKR